MNKIILIFYKNDIMEKNLDILKFRYFKSRSTSFIMNMSPLYLSFDSKKYKE